MVSLAITENPPALVYGIPDYYVSDEDFKEILKDAKKARALYEYFGKSVCIGRLGKLQNDVYEETEIPLVEFHTEDLRKGLSFYEKVL